MFKKIIHKYFALEEIKELGRECSHYILKLFYFSTEADPEHAGRICPLPFFFFLSKAKTFGENLCKISLSIYT